MGSWTNRLPFGRGTEARKQKWMESMLPDLPLREAVEVPIFGTDKYEFVKGATLGYAKIFNEKLGIWQNEPCHDYYDICPVCGKLMHVYVVPGTTYVAACSKGCTDFIVKLMREDS